MWSSAAKSSGIVPPRPLIVSRIASPTSLCDSRLFGDALAFQARLGLRGLEVVRRQLLVTSEVEVLALNSENFQLRVWA